MAREVIVLEDSPSDSGSSSSRRRSPERPPAPPVPPATAAASAHSRRYGAAVQTALAMAATLRSTKEAVVSMERRGAKGKARRRPPAQKRAAAEGSSGRREADRSLGTSKKEEMRPSGGDRDASISRGCPSGGEDDSRANGATAKRPKERKRRERVSHKRRRHRASTRSSSSSSSSSSLSDESPAPLAQRLEQKRSPLTVTAPRRTQPAVRRRGAAPEVVEILSSASSASDSSSGDDRSSRRQSGRHHIQKRRRVSGSLSSTGSPASGSNPPKKVTASMKTTAPTVSAALEQRQTRPVQTFNSDRRSAKNPPGEPSSSGGTSASRRVPERSQTTQWPAALPDRRVHVQNAKFKKAMAKSVPMPSSTMSSTASSTPTVALRAGPERGRPSPASNSDSTKKKYLYCKKSGSTEPIPPRRSPPPSPPRSSAPQPLQRLPRTPALPRPPQRRERSLSPPSSPDVTVLSRNHRMSSSSGFNADNVPLEDLQAQERELAYIQAVRKQARSHSSKTTRPRAKVEPRRQQQQQQQQQQHSPGEVIEIDGDHSDTGSEAEVEMQSLRNESHQQEERPTPQRAAAKTTKLIAHSTSFRAVYVDVAPANLLNAGDESADALGFILAGDRPLTCYADDAASLEKQCAFLADFGQPKQLLSSFYPAQPALTQEETSRSVQSVADEFLPVIRDCQRRKARAIIGEARRRTLAYSEAVQGFREEVLDADVSACRLSSATSDRRQARKALRATSPSRRSCTFAVGRDGVGQSLEREMTVLAYVRPVSRWTTSIGTKSSIRVEDDPILRHSAAAGPGTPGLVGGAGGGPSVASGSTQAESMDTSRYGLRVGSAADEEVVEFAVRLVVARLGDSDQVFHALKTELGLAQAYTDYLEHKKQHERREASATRWSQLQSAVGDARFPFRSEMKALLEGMSSVTLDPSGIHTKAGCDRRPGASKWIPRPHPDHVVESNLLSNWLGCEPGSNNTGGRSRNRMAGIRVSSDFGELAERFTDAFCRLCFTYDCQEHGSQGHPLPLRRVDPVFPALRLPRSLHDPSRLSVGVSGELWRDVVARAVDADADADGEESDDVVDPTEYLDSSHAKLVMARMREMVGSDTPCSSECWKAPRSPTVENDGDSAAGDAATATTTSGSSLDGDVPSLGVTDIAVLNKLRSVVGDAPCVLAALAGCAPCAAVHRLLQRDGGGSASADARSETSRRSRSWRSGRALAGGARHQDLLRRTRNERLRDRGCANHEYRPCSHDGPCNSMACSCMTRDHMCEKACACPRDCPNRFEGCACAPGTCQASGSCPCVAALRECDPDRCVSCGASEIAVAVAVATRGGQRRLARRAACSNVSVQRGAHKRLRMGFSSIHGWGVFAAEPIASGQFVYEYTGALLSQDEAERRGFVYDHNERSYLFDLNEDAVVDAMRNGNKSKFVNHRSSPGQNCRARVLNVGGVHHIGVWAERDIAAGEELSFDYGYSGGAAPDWSQRRVAS